MMSEFDEHLADELTRLNSAIENLDSDIGRLSDERTAMRTRRDLVRQLLGMDTDRDIDAAESGTHAPTSGPRKLTAAVELYLRQSEQVTVPARDLKAAVRRDFPDASTHTISATLSYLKRKGLANNPRHGHWQWVGPGTTA